MIGHISYKSEMYRKTKINIEHTYKENTHWSLNLKMASRKSDRLFSDIRGLAYLRTIAFVSIWFIGHKNEIDLNRKKGYNWWK